MSNKPAANESADYAAYVQDEWQAFHRDGTRRAAATSDAVRRALGEGAFDGKRLRRVLDIGCGAGQEMLPLISDGRVFGVGIDVACDAGAAGSELFARQYPKAQIAFMRATAEALPFADASFEAVICRLALPYMDNRLALSEMSRVLAPGGVLLLKIHHARYYWGKWRAAVRQANWLSAIHAVRVLIAGTIYGVRGRQVKTKLISRETFQTRRMLERELSNLKLEIVGELRDTNPATPSFCISKQCENRQRDV